MIIKSTQYNQNHEGGTRMTEAEQTLLSLGLVKASWWFVRAQQCDAWSRSSPPPAAFQIIRHR